jgi:hypothetical protein
MDEWNAYNNITAGGYPSAVIAQDETGHDIYRPTSSGYSILKTDNGWKTINPYQSYLSEYNAAVGAQKRNPDPKWQPNLPVSQQYPLTFGGK